ncbi:membrane-bound PQQ-dependent dehydrogenase, glucose/quinate/shikimate family [Luteibacter yeojuensis]|uniref:Membrane-bound PQQ-dependent dehydrogenase, glucose/quinate/shikimate family n=1 Tax=Luteibacter yeojuensis TaxID=345309 RepID=A0A7X5QV37_9GAMM|nr:membrane-bound PQQ-dependent dehydrogenase, glucose/quinate/shikimate family [Luteibacter yeojuensis]NID15969.1 membrane-bound PQQ-dependent dehydrogenase, glucose/quinate/shikimate family [Luteibacter yeojuensis]
MTAALRIAHPPRILGLVVALCGAALALGGLWLVVLGGSFYYLVAGAALVATGVLLMRGSSASLWLYAVLLLGTVVWAIAEVGLVGWQLEPRLLVPVVLGIYLAMPWVTRRLTPSRGGVAALLVAALVAVGTGVAGFMQPVGTSGTMVVRNDAGGHDTSVPDGDWLFYGRTPRGDRFSPLDQITTRNVKNLKVAWTARTGDTMRPGEDKGGTDAGHEFNFENTPIKVGDTLYVCTGHSWVVALDAATGRTKWTFDPKADTDADVYLACRGVAYYEAPQGTQTDCPRRIIAPVLDARLMALNADTGKPCEDFGQHGFISLTQYLGHVPAGFHFVTSPPLVIKDRVMLGGWIYDNQAEGEPSGAVRAFDPLSGKLVWAWDVGHDPQNWTPGPDDQLTRGTPNAWGVYTADPDLGLVYLPMGNATPDYFGGHRRAIDEKVSSSTVALDIETGAPKWVYQNTHHDVWDMDVPVGPSLVDLPDGQGGSVPALVQTTKRGEFFVLDRRTGTPLTEVREKPVPQGAVPGDFTSPTQPYSVGMPSLTPKDLTEQSMWGATPFDQLMCRIEFRKAYYKGQFTPPQLKDTIVYPAFDGVIDWHGASIDPYNKLLIANANYIPFIISLAPREHAEAKGLVKPWDGTGNEPPVGGGLAPQYGTPYVGKVHPWLNPIGVPCNPPPWGTLAAIDLVTHKLVWEHPLGTTRDTGPFGTHVNAPLPTGIFNIGGNMTTRGGLVFIGATADDYLRAIDERSGKVLWKARLPAGGQANPMSYSVDGKQYVVIAAGGHSGLGTKSGDYVVAYALP